jgi:hypothetical protein
LIGNVYLVLADRLQGILAQYFSSHKSLASPKSIFSHLPDGPGTLGSFGGATAGNAAIKSSPGEIGRIVFLGAAPK